MYVLVSGYGGFPVHMLTMLWFVVQLVLVYTLYILVKVILDQS